MRKIMLASLSLAALSAPAFAETAAPAATNDAAAQKAILAETGAALEARQHLVRQGYINVSPLNQDDNGRWVGTASKGGKTVIVAIDLRHAEPKVEIN